jgi:hypothetical protein
MANRKISDLTALTATATGDLLPIVDISEAAAADKNKKITIEKLFQGIPGNVGIGTSAPSHKLDVAGAGDQTVAIRTSISGDPKLYLEASGVNGGSVKYNRASQLLQLSAQDPTAHLTITNAGNVGIGTTSPARKLEIANGDIRLSDGYVIEWGAAGNYIFGSSTSNFLAFSSSGNERARIDSSGRLLVGTSTARSVATQSSSFQIEGTSFATTGLSSCRNSNDVYSSYLHFGKTRGSTVGSNTIVSPGDDLGGLVFGGGDGTSVNSQAAYILCQVDGTPGVGDMPGRLTFWTTPDGSASPTERMRIGSNGATVIGHANNVYQLYLNSTATSGYTDTILRADFSGYAPNNTTAKYFSFGDTAVIRAELRSNGGLANFQANNVNLSDINTKKDISPAADTWNCLKEWEIVNYRYKDQPDDADLNLGVIAQQIAESCPEVITIFQEAKEATETEPAKEERLGVKEQQMYWMAIKALQEAQVRIEQLESKVAALESV